MKKIISLFIVTICVYYLQAQQSKLNIEIERLKKDEALKHATWSVCVMNTKTTAIVGEYNSNVSVIPASTLKIVTTGAALSMLGNDFRFETKIQYDGILDSITGILKGNIYIVGGGDPTLESYYFKNKKDSLTVVEKWAAILKNKGIKKIEGAVIADASIFEDNMIPSQWIWGDIGNYFGVGVSGLSYHDNKYSAYLKSNESNTKTVLNKIEPTIPELEFINNVNSGGKTDSAFIYGAPFSNYRMAEGTIPPNQSNFEIEGAIPDPALFCARMFNNALKENNITVTKEATTVRILKERNNYKTSSKKNLHINYSPTLDKIVYWTNFKSLNLYAEHLLKYIAYKKTGVGSEVNGTQIITEFWKNKGVDVSGLYMTDGSGLARANLITTKIEAIVLSMMTKDKTFDAFYNSFPISGKPGSLSSMGDGTLAENNLRAKSGYLTKARGYAGYVKSKKGEMLCFSVLSNNYECSPTEMRLKLEKLLIAMAELE